MSVADAKRLVPGLRDDPRSLRDQLILDSGVRDVELAVRIDAGTVLSIVAVVQGHGARDLLTQAWGTPEITRDSLNQPEVTWASEATGWKVKLDCLERNCIVEYSPYHALTAKFFGAHVVPPGELADLRIGMKLAEARKVAPGPVDVRSGIAASVDGVREFVGIDDKAGTIRSIYLNVPQHAEDLIADAWGVGTPVVDLGGKRALVWPDPTTGWRATLRDALGYSHDLAFDNYLPAAQLFGDQPDALAGLASPVLGKTVDEVKKAYPDDVAIQGKDVVLSLPPTEWERTTTRVALNIASGRVRSLSFAIPFKVHPEARDTLLALFTAKWGDPKPFEVDGKPVGLLFRDDDPRVEVVEDDEHGAWHVELK
jgi:hypothetical protein